MSAQPGAEDDAADNDAAEQPSAGKPKSKKRKRGPSPTSFAFVAPVSRNLPGNKSKDERHRFLLGKTRTPLMRLEDMHAFYKSWHSGLPLFPELMPTLHNWEPLNDSERVEYFPSGVSSVPFSCVAMADRMQECSLDLGDTASYNGNMYGYTGGPIWAIEWCPLSESELSDSQREQVMAVAIDIREEKIHDANKLHSGPGMIQFWSCGAIENKKESVSDLKLQFSIVHDYGYVRSLAWCPVKGFCETVKGKDVLPRLGLLAVACSDGNVVVYSIPDNPFQASQNYNNTMVMAKPKPSLFLSPNSTRTSGPCLSVAWQLGGESNLIAGGFGQGVICVWDLNAQSSLLRIDPTTIRPVSSLLQHAGAVLSMCFSYQPEQMLVSTSYDHTITVWDLERKQISMQISRQIETSRAVVWAGPMYCGFFSAEERLYATQDCSVIYRGLMPALKMHPVFLSHVQQHTSCIWDLDFNPDYEVLLTCDATGKVRIALLDLEQMRFKNPGKVSTNWFVTPPTATLYQTEVISRPSSSSLVTLSTPTPTPSAADINRTAFEDAVNPPYKPPEIEESLYFMDAKKAPSSVTMGQQNIKGSKNSKAKALEVEGLERFGDSNTLAIHRARLNPNRSCCLWSATGGQAGLLRLDNLSSLVLPHRKKAEEIIHNLNMENS